MADDVRKKVVLFGGSFNPPHRGHAAFAKAAAAHGDELWVLPSGDRRDKTPGLTDARRAMAEAFARDLAAELPVPVRVETIELELAPPVWTYRTLAELAERYPGHSFSVAATSEILPDVRGKWKDGEALWREADFLLAHRPGHAAPEELPPTCRIMEIESPLPISSTEIRAAIARGETVEAHLTPEVAALVRSLVLYAAETR